MDKFSNTLQLITSGKEILILFIIINNAAVGIVTSLFLKSMTSILKTFASALELLFTSILAWIIFAIPVSIYTFIAIFVVSTAVYIYSTNPVVNLSIEPNPIVKIEDEIGQERRVIV
jgi:drug/metabolite transporter (DMT)-like permease